jgi:2-keto-3-deoxy-L-rhamnonate aldolase RhmA
LKNFTNPALDRLRAGEVAIGVGVRRWRDAAIGRIMTSCGYDFLFIDLEHGTLALESAADISVAAADAGIAPFVRVPEKNFTLATRALDSGALGIVMPHVETAEEAREIAARLRYPPLGHRSYAGSMTQLGFANAHPTEAMKAVDAATLIVAMLESPAAIAEAEPIAATPGIDVLLVGMGDLTVAMGMPDQFETPRATQAVERVIAACRAHGKWPGLAGIGDAAIVARYVAQGVRMVQIGGEIAMLMAEATRRAAVVRKADSKA